VRIAAGVAHGFRNASCDDVLVRATLRPALRTEELFEQLFRLGAQGKVNKLGARGAFTTMRLIRQFRSEFFHLAGGAGVASAPARRGVTMKLYVCWGTLRPLGPGTRAATPSMRYAPLAMSPKSSAATGGGCSPPRSTAPKDGASHERPRGSHMDSATPHRRLGVDCRKRQHQRMGHPSAGRELNFRVGQQADRTLKRAALHLCRKHATSDARVPQLIGDSRAGIRRNSFVYRVF
jgi:hypothetical protein